MIIYCIQLKYMLAHIHGDAMLHNLFIACSRWTAYDNTVLSEVKLKLDLVGNLSGISFELEQCSPIKSLALLVQLVIICFEATWKHLQVYLLWTIMVSLLVLVGMTLFWIFSRFDLYWYFVFYLYMMHWFIKTLYVIRNITKYWSWFFTIS